MRADGSGGTGLPRSSGPWLTETGHLVGDRGQLGLFHKDIETIIINVLGRSERSNAFTRWEANDCGFRVSAQLGHATVRPMQADPGHFRFHDP